MCSARFTQLSQPRRRSRQMMSALPWARRVKAGIGEFPCHRLESEAGERQRQHYSSAWACPATGALVGWHSKRQTREHRDVGRGNSWTTDTPKRPRPPSASRTKAPLQFHRWRGLSSAYLLRRKNSRVCPGVAPRHFLDQCARVALTLLLLFNICSLLGTAWCAGIGVRPCGNPRGGYTSSSRTG